MPDIYVMNGGFSATVVIGLLVSAVVVWVWQWATGEKK
ncbi:membrane protein [Microbacterium phage Shocker]|uniref:Membrane protein n=1 Tax=Microbacterium phage Shocker TaxID=2805839 RepID=A0A890UN92_9CAUD|nr:membrane protein [Microbacterium phage Shocker]QRI45065.1 membrane protein [Microbacterium phage Shocker]